LKQAYLASPASTALFVDYLKVSPLYGHKLTGVGAE
jgi:hypothetical protein